MRETLAKYLKIFGGIYPKRPAFEHHVVYERALADIGDENLAAACELCLKECTYYPTPAEIRKRLPPPDNFVATAPKFEETKLSPEDLAAIGAGFGELAEKLSSDRAARAARKQEIVKTFEWPGINFTASVRPGTSLVDWAKQQDLREDLPRSPQELDFIRMVHYYERPPGKRKRRRRS